MRNHFQRVHSSCLIGHVSQLPLGSFTGFGAFQHPKTRIILDWTKGGIMRAVCKNHQQGRG